MIILSDEEGYLPVIDEKELEEGKMKLVRVDGVPVLFIKKNGELYVIDNRCPHMGVGLSGGTLDNNFVVCSSHGWRFSLETGEYEHDPSYRLVAYPFKIKDSKIWVKVEEDL